MKNKYAEWNRQFLGATQICDIDYLTDRLSKLKYPHIILTSGGFDPIHPGHISCIRDSPSKVLSCLDYRLVVLVNGTNFLLKKKGYEFIPLEARCQIVGALKGVHYVVPFEPSDPNDMTVCEAIEKLKPHYFTKGGDRIDASTIPEWDVCAKNNVKIITGVGLLKKWSSSHFTQRLLNEHK